MPHSSFKKTYSLFLVAALVAVNVVQVPVVFAGAVYTVNEAKTSAGFLGKKVEDARDLVAVIVDQDVWNDPGTYAGLKGGEDLKGRIQRYADDVQKALPKTQVMILPVSQEPKTVLKLQQVLERLYLEGDPENSSPTQLTGVVLVGDVPLPVVHKGSQFFMSLLPYTDFVDPEYVFSSTSQTFEKATGSTETKPEVWHGVIRPPLSGVDGRKQLAEYFDKNHLYHTGDPAYANFQKKVFVSDLVREEKNLSTATFPRYEEFLKNMGDLAYHRYSAKWLALLKAKFDPETGDGGKGVAALNDETTKFNEGIKNDPNAQKKTDEEQAAADDNAVGIGQYKQAVADGMGGKKQSPDDVSKMPDIQAAAPILKYHLQYPQLFSSFLNLATDWVGGSGRWSDQDVETIPALIAKKDAYMSTLFKSINDSVEAKIDEQLEKIAKPVGLNTSVTVSGYTAVLNNSLVPGGDPVPINSKFYQDYPISETFINNSSLEIDSQPVQFVNGLRASVDLTHVQQCTRYAGTMQTEQVAGGTSHAVSQVVGFLRSLNLGTLSLDGSKVGQPRSLWSLGLHVRPLSGDQASTLTGGKYSYGAQAGGDAFLGIPLFSPHVGTGSPIQNGDIILTIDGKQISPTYTVEQAARTHGPGPVAVTYWRNGFGEPQTTNAAIYDANQDSNAGGCYAVNYQNTKNLLDGVNVDANGKPVLQGCFPEVATDPIADRAGAYAIKDSDVTPLSDEPEACNNFSSSTLFTRFVKGLVDQKHPEMNFKGIMDYLSELRGKGNTTIVPHFPSHTPSDIPLRAPGEGLLPNGSTGAIPSFTLQNFFDNYGFLNGKDDNGDWYDTNGNGKADPIQWIDLNGNGKLDLVPFAPKVGESIPPGRFTIPGIVNTPQPILSDEEIAKLMKNGVYTGKPVGEFVGGDWGVDDPLEGAYSYQGSWKNIEKDFFEIDAPKIYTSTKLLPTSFDFTCDHPGTPSSCYFIHDVLPSLSLTFKPTKAKDLSSVSYHKEPRAETLRAQFQGGFSQSLPIDRPRHATYVKAGAGATSTAVDVYYPDVFSAGTFDEYASELSAIEKTLGVADGYLTSMFQGGGSGKAAPAGAVEATKTLADGQKVFTIMDANKAKSFLDWKNLSLEMKHQQVLAEYLNPGINGYIDDANGDGTGAGSAGGAMGYEALYFVADGKPTYYTTNFSGEPPVDETDSVYNQIVGGTVVWGDANGAPPAGAGAGKAPPAGGVDDDVPSGKDFYDEPVDIMKWFEAMGKWWDETKNSFRAIGLSLSKPFDGNIFNSTVNGSSSEDMIKKTAAQKLSISLSKPLLKTGGDSMEVTITGQYPNDKVADKDHTSAVWLSVEGDSGGTEISPDPSELSDISFSYRDEATDKFVVKDTVKGIFLSDGVAKFQIVSGNKQGKLIVRAHGYNGTTKMSSDSATVLVNDVHLSVDPEQIVLTAGTDKTNIEVQVLDTDDHVVDVSSEFTVKADGPDDMTMSGLSGDKLKIDHGVATFSIAAGKKSGDVHLTFEPSVPSLPTAEANLTITGGTPTTLSLSGLSGILTPNGFMNETLRADVVDAYGNPLKDQIVHYTISTSGPIEITDITDADSKTDGIQKETYAGSLTFGVRSKAGAGAGTGTISVTGVVSGVVDDNGESADIILKTSGTIAVRDDLHLELDSSNTIMPADGGSQSIFTAALKDTSGSVVAYNGPVSFTIGSKGLGSFATAAPSNFVYGKAFVSVKAGVKAGTLPVYVDGLGLPSARASVALQPLAAMKMKVTSGVKVLAIKSGSGNGGGNAPPAGGVVISLFDGNGNLVSGSGSGNGVPATAAAVPITVRVTKDTQKYGYLQTANGGLTNQLTVYTSNGKAAVNIFPTNVPGPIHLVFSSNGLASDTFEIITRGRTGPGQAATFSPNVLYASMLGGPFGNVTEQNYFAGNMLFSGKMQAAAAITTESEPHHQMMSLNPYGGMELLDPNVQFAVASSGDQDPMRVDILGDLGKTSLGTVLVKQSATPVLVDSLDSSAVSGKAGIFVKMEDGATSITSLPSAGGLSLKEKETQIASINSSGGIHVNDPRVTLQVAGLDSSSSSKSSKYLRVEILLSGNIVTTVQIGFDAVNTISLQNAMPALADLSNGVWLVQYAKEGNLAFEQSYAGYSTSDARGYHLVNLSKDALDHGDSLGSSYTSLDSSLKTAGVGFIGDNKHMLLLAAGNTVGEAHLSYPSEIGIVLGDPTVTLMGSNPHTETGFTKDLGKNIYTSTANARVLLPIDVNSDGKKDLLVGSADGKVRYLQYTGGAQRFRDRGVLIDVTNGIRVGVTGDINHDGKDDAIFAVEQNCTKKDTCVDLYRNTGGFFVRENLGLAIDASLKVATMQLADMNQDGWLDLVVALTNGEIRIFMNQQGKFVSVGQTVGKLDVSSHAPIALLVSAALPGASALPGGGGSDKYPDIFARVVSGTGTGAAPSSASGMYFISSAPKNPGDNVTYEKFDAPKKQTQEKAAEDLQNGLAGLNPSGGQTIDGDMQATLKNLGVKLGDPPTAPPTDATTQYNNAMANDTDGDGIPDAIVPASGGVDDLIGGANHILDDVTKTIDALRCGKGCFPMPVNYAALVPGPINVNGAPVGFQTGIPVFGAASSACGNWPIWPGCPYTQPDMSFRIYISPTLTGQLGFAICTGGPYPTGQCYAFAPNISLIPSSICKAITSAMNSAMTAANNFGQAVGGALPAFMNGGSGGLPTGGTNNTTDSGSDLLHPYIPETITTTNIRVPGFPKFLTDWLDKQIEEVMNKLADLPDLYIKYPSFSSIANAVTPKVPQGKLSGYTKFLAYLNSIPLISIDPKPLSIRVPALSPAQIAKFKNSIQSFGTDFVAEIKRVKNLLQCDIKKTNPDPAKINICQAITVNAGVTFKKIQNILDALDKLKNLPKKILAYRMIQTKYIQQIINYLRTISGFMGGYVKRQEMRLANWIDAIKQIKQTLGTWQALVDVTTTYNAQCDSCKTEKGSLFQIFTQLFVNIPSPPVIPFPKWPDIVLDFSQLEAGIHVSWPDLTFSPQQIILPTLPPFRLPIDSASLASPGSLGSLKMNLDLSKYFPTLPDFPTIPDLPNLPDLPPLTVFKLPDLPPAPKITGLGTFKGVDIKGAIDILKQALKIVCIYKKGYTAIQESSLKTEIEELTQRSLLPPLAADLNAGIDMKYPAIKYDAIDQFAIRGKMKLEVQTDFIYNFFKKFADRANSVTTNLVNGANKAGADASKAAEEIVQPDLSGAGGKKTSYAPQYYTIAVDASKVGAGMETGAAAPSGASYLGGLEYALTSYLKNNQTSSAQGMDDMIANVTPVHSTHSLAHYLTQAGVLDAGTGDGNVAPASAVKVTGPGRLLALGADGTPGSASSTAESDNLYKNYAEATQTMLGMYIQNPVSGHAEKLMDYTLEMKRDPKEISVDMDGDGDGDAIYSFGGDIYFKENQNNKTINDSFNGIIDKSPRVASLDSLLPVLSAVHGIQTDYSQKQSVTVTWDANGNGIGNGGGDVPAGAGMGYELYFRDAFGTARKRYLYPEAAGKIPYEDGVTVDTLTKSDQQSVSFPLEYGTTFFQITPLDINGKAGTPSDVHILAPQLCGDTSAPLTSAGSGEQFVAITKTLPISAASSIDAKSTIVKYFIDTDTSVDTDNNSDPTDDQNIAQDSPAFTLGPFTKEQDMGVKVWTENAQSIRSGQAITIHVFTPDIVLSDVSMKDGTAYGHVAPAVAQMPFSLIRERGGSPTALGDYTTDDQGNFMVNGLTGEGKIILKNAKDEAVAEYNEATGKVTIIKAGYTVSASTDNSQHILVATVKDATGTIVGSFFQTPDGNTDSVIDSASFAYTPVTVTGLKGVHLKDMIPTDTLVFHTIAANDPNFFGGTEIIDTSTGKRVAVIDSSGHAYILDPTISLQLEDIPDMPYIYDLRRANLVIGQIFIGSVSNKHLSVLDGAAFASTEADSLLLPSQTPSNPIFADVETGSDSYESIKLLQELGIVEGYQENGKLLFKPDQLISRSEYTKIMLKVLCIEPRPEAYLEPSTFNDIAFTNPLLWYYSFVKESHLLSLITGYLGEKDSSGLTPFKPLAFISRAEATKILIEALKMLKIINLAGVEDDPTQPWYAPSIKAALNLLPFFTKKSTTPEPFIITGPESINPDYQITRGDFAIMATRALRIANCHNAPKAQAPSLLPPPSVKVNFLKPGLYGYLPICKSCPCTSTIDHTGKLLPGDVIFAILSPKDHSVVYRKSNTVILGPP